LRKKGRKITSFSRQNRLRGGRIRGGQGRLRSKLKYWGKSTAELERERDVGGKGLQI